MGHALEFELLQGVQDWLNVDPGGPEQLFTDGAAQFLDMIGGVQLGLGKEDAPDQGVAVAVQAAEARPMSTSPALIADPSMRSAFSQAPTANPARSYSWGR